MLENMSAFNDKANVVILNFVNSYEDSPFVILLIIIILLGFTSFIMFLRGLWLNHLKEKLCYSERSKELLKEEYEDEISSLKTSNEDYKILVKKFRGINSDQSGKIKVLKEELRFTKEDILNQFIEIFSEVGLISRKKPEKREKDTTHGIDSRSAG